MIQKRKEIPFLITISYLLAIIFIRTSVFIAGSANTKFASAAEQGLRPDIKFHIGSNIILFGYHIHHFYIGILLICIAAWIAIVGSKTFSIKQAAIMYGSGLGLFFDEIGLLLTWGDYYSSLTYVISIIMLGIFLNIVFFNKFWESTKENISRTKPTPFIWKKMINNHIIYNVIDNISKKTGRTKRTSLLFTGLLYILASTIILKYTILLRYCIAGTFIIQGMANLIEIFANNKEI